MGRLPPAWIVVWTLLCISGQRGSRVASGVLPSLLEGRAAEHESWRVRLLRRCGLLSEGLVSGLFPSEGLVSGLGVRPHPAALPKRARPARPAACTGCPRPGLDGLPLEGMGLTGPGCAAVIAAATASWILRPPAASFLLVLPPRSWLQRAATLHFSVKYRVSVLVFTENNH